MECSTPHIISNENVEETQIKLSKNTQQSPHNTYIIRHLTSYIPSLSVSDNPTLSPLVSNKTPSPIASNTITETSITTTDAPISNGCDPECKSDEVCLANGDCQSKLSTTECTSTAECIANDGKNYECELENNGGFCYYSECKKDGECQTGYICNVQTDANGDNVLYAYGICEGNGDESGVDGLYGFKKSMLILLVVWILL